MEAVVKLYYIVLFFFLVNSLCTDAERRLGRHQNGIDEIISHPFFRGVDWEHIR